MIIDNTNNLYEFCEKYKIKLIGEYSNVKNSTIIYYECQSCCVKVKKSYKCLTKYKDNEFIGNCGKFCHKCFRVMMH